jgi:predicted metalloprotease with PDZ domain
LSHEYFHAWNVKRIRPAEMWPYAYDHEQYTPLLWMSEGITDYYAGLVLARLGLWSEEALWEDLAGAIGNVEALAPASVEDASLDTWIDPVYAPGNFYYDKGKLIGLLIDVMIRDATEGEQGLDDVMRRLYRERFLAGDGFTTEDFLAYVGEHVGEEAVESFYRRHIDGRERLPYEILEKIGIDYIAETRSEPFLGVGLQAGPEGGLVVVEVVPESTAAEAGLAAGDVLLRVGSVELSGPDWADRFRAEYADREGEPLVLTYRRDGEEATGEATVRIRQRTLHRLEVNAQASERARELREGLLGK